MRVNRVDMSKVNLTSLNVNDTIFAELRFRDNALHAVYDKKVTRD